MSKTSHCLINPQGGTIEIQLSVNNGVKSGSLFTLWELNQEDWITKESFNLITSDDGIDERILSLNPPKTV